MEYDVALRRRNPGRWRALEATAHLARGPNYSFSPTVVDLRPNERYAWLGTTGVRGLFDGEHSFELEPVDENRTRLTNREVYSGLLAPIFRRLPMMQDAPQGFEAMNAEIKAYTEANA